MRRLTVLFRQNDWSARYKRWKKHVFNLGFTTKDQIHQDEWWEILVRLAEAKSLFVVYSILKHLIWKVEWVEMVHPSNKLIFEETNRQRALFRHLDQATLKLSSLAQILWIMQTKLATKKSKLDFNYSCQWWKQSNEIKG